MGRHPPRRCLFGLRKSVWRWVSVLLVLVTFPRISVAAAAGPRLIDATAFGKSVLLKENWVAAAGNDPHWASPDFDDSGWTALQQGKPLPMPAFAGTRSIWFRMHVQARPHGPPLALYIEGLPFNYSIYVNGVRIGQQGDMRPMQPDRLHPAEGFRVPSQLIEGAEGRLLIAIHVVAGPVGFLNFSPMKEQTRLELVNPGEVQLRESYRLAHKWSESFALLAFNLLVGLCGLVIWWSLREQREYLALAIWLIANAATVVANFAAYLTGAAPMGALGLLLVSLLALGDVAELEFMRLLLKRRQSVFWLCLEAIVVAAEFYIPLFETGRVPLRPSAAIAFVRPLITEVFIGFALLRGTLRGNRDAPLLLLPVALWSLSDLYYIASLVLWFGFKVLWPDLPALHFFSYEISFRSLATVLGLLSLVMIILRRTIRLSREKADLAAEMAAAEQLQLLLMARASRPTPGYRVDTEYRPMQQVGGDFFLVQPCEEDASLVAIVGDVSGKGLQAAMRVSMILGVLQREVMGRPERVLKTLNAALLAQGDLGFTTACCVRLETDGSFCFANAGHLNPYINGQEFVAEGALPLGMDAEASYPVSCGRMEPGQRLVLFSDGVLEARNRNGELLGFERMRGLAGSAVGEIADAAQRFGQEDDITVLALALA